MRGQRLVSRSARPLYKPGLALCVFDQVIGTAASFNRTLWTAVGTAIGTEGRVFFNLGNSGEDWKHIGYALALALFLSLSLSLYVCMYV